MRDEYVCAALRDVVDTRNYDYGLTYLLDRRTGDG